MKKIIRILPVLTIMLMLVAGMSANAFAVSYDGECYFDGTNMIEDFRSDEIATAISNLQPGDDVTFTVRYQNKYSEPTDWYMENRVFQTLERTSAARKNKYVSGNSTAEHGGYTYELIQVNKNGTRNVLFSNATVGGDDGTVQSIQNPGKELTGLEPSTNALDDWFYIDTLQQNESGTVELHVAFDGETEVNDYMDTDGEVNVRFAVELTGEGTPPPTPPVKTGDESRLILWATIGLIAGLLMLILAFLSRRRDEKAEAAAGGSTGSLGKHERRR